MPKKPTHHEIHADLSDDQVKKLKAGKTVQLKHHQIGSGARKLQLCQTKWKKMHKAHREGKGCRLQMSQNELHATGFLSNVGRVLKAGFDAWKRNVVPVVGPEMRSGLTKALPVIASAAVTALGAPEAAPVVAALAAKAAPAIVNGIGNSSGAWGLPHGKGKKRSVVHARRCEAEGTQRSEVHAKTHLRFELADHQSNLLNYMHPALHPHLPLPSYGTPNVSNNGSPLRGGSFLALSNP